MDKINIPNKMKTKIYVTLIFLTLFTFFSCKEDVVVKEDSTPAISVKTARVSEGNTNSFLTSSGKIEAGNSASLSTRLMGYVDKIHVKVGDKIKKGQLLVSINSADLIAKRAQVNSGISEANVVYQNAKNDFNRFTALFNDSSVSQKELDDITAHFNMAKARLESAKQMKNEINAQFSYTHIKAPFSGVVTNKFINVGDMANPGVPLLEVEAPENFQVLAMVSESNISKIKVDSKVKVVVKSLNKIIKGKVVEVSTSSKNTGGQYLVKIALGSTEVKVLSGMFATVQFPNLSQDKSDIVLIPIDAIVTRGQLSGVYTVSQSNTAMLRWLRLGKTFGDKVEVLSGLSANEEYIISASNKLSNGSKITIQ